MKNNIKFRFAGIGIMLVICAVFGAAVMFLWNALMPQIFGFPQISYLQAAGLLILARILFGGIGSGGWDHATHWGARGYTHGNKLREKWMNMSEDERKEFIKKERGFAHWRDFYGNDETGTKNEKPEMEG
jgi:hypothetical protein